MRKAIKTHLFEKIRFNELGPKTIRNYFARMNNFRDFLYERFDNPSPALITRNLIEDNYLSWGNDNNKSGKNWFTDIVAMSDMNR